MERKDFKQFYSRIAREGLLKSFLCGLIVGFAVDFIVAFALWFTSINSVKALLICLGAGVAAILISMPIFYFKLFRPTTHDIARRVDQLGLEERIITMMQLEHDETYIAMRQREDARHKMGTVKSGNIRFIIPKALIIAAAAVVVCGLSMTTVTALATEGHLPGGGDIWDDITSPPDEYIAVSYVASEGGFINGESEQLVLKGGNTETVVAVADDGWMFYGWDDGKTDPSREDLKVTEEFEIYAIFMPLGPDDGSGNQSSNGDGDGAADAPGGSNDGNPSNAPEDSKGNGASGKYEEHNQVIDGDTYYRDVYQEYYDRAMEILAENGELPPSLRAIIEAYFGIIL